MEKLRSVTVRVEVDTSHATYAEGLELRDGESLDEFLARVAAALRGLLPD